MLTLTLILLGLFGLACGALSAYLEGREDT